MATAAHPLFVSVPLHREVVTARLSCSYDSTVGEVVSQVYDLYPALQRRPRHLFTLAMPGDGRPLDRGKTLRASGLIPPPSEETESAAAAAQTKTTSSAGEAASLSSVPKKKTAAAPGASAREAENPSLLEAVTRQYEEVCGKRSSDEVQPPRLWLTPLPPPPPLVVFFVSAKTGLTSVVQVGEEESVEYLEQLAARHLRLCGQEEGSPGKEKNFRLLFMGRELLGGKTLKQSLLQQQSRVYIQLLRDAPPLSAVKASLVSESTAPLPSPSGKSPLGEASSS